MEHSTRFYGVPMTTTAKRISRNHLLNYASKRVEDAVLAPLRTDTTQLEVAEEHLDRLRIHFRRLWIDIRPLGVVDGQFAVAITEVPRG
jgi:hypothetical protein